MNSQLTSHITDMRALPRTLSWGAPRMRQFTAGRREVTYDSSGRRTACGYFPRLKPQPAPQAPQVRCSAQPAQKATALPPSLKKIVGAFQMVPDPMARYKQLLYYATKLAPLPAEDHVPENKVEGCVSQVWVKPELRSDGLIYWSADSDSQLTKGLAALLVTGLSGCTAEEIMQVDPNFIEMLGLKQSLTPSRNNGFLNMLRLMQKKSMELTAAAGSGDPVAASFRQDSGPLPSSSNSAEEATSSAPSSSSSSSVPSSSTTPVQDGVRRKLTESLKPSKLTIIDESHKHAGHAAMHALPGKAGGSGETHFIVEIVSEAFEGVPIVKRHRMIYQLLDQEMASMGLHALSLDTKTPSEVK